MQKILIPRLESPFPARINPLVKEADEHTADWLRRFKLVSSEEVLQYYRRQGFAYMVSRMFPTANLENLCAFSDLNTLLFLIDDQFDHQNGKIHGTPSVGSSLQLFIHGFISVLKTPRPYSLTEDGAIYSALSDVWTRLKRNSDWNWQRKFIAGIEAIFSAAIWQYKNVLSGYEPTEEEYMARRAFLGAANVATDSIPVAENILLPDEVMNSAIVQKLTSLCRDTVCWANDLFSLSKELAHEDYYNLVMVLKKKRKLTMENAILNTALIHNAQIGEFLALAKQAFVFDPAVNQELSRYVTALTAIMRGNVDWSERETTRYSFAYVEHRQNIEH